MNFVYVVPLGVVAIMIVGLNLYCVLSKNCTRSSRMTVFSLLFVHLIQGLIVIPMYAVKKSGITEYIILQVVCVIFRFTYLLTNYVSLFSVVNICIHRFYAIKYPVKHLKELTSRRTAIAVVSSWIYVTILCLIPFLPSNSPERDCYYYHPQRQWTTFMLIMNTLLPFVTVVVCYLYIFQKANLMLFTNISQRRCIGQAEPENLQGRRRTLMDIKKTKTSILIVFFYIVCWGPSFVYFLLKSLCPHCFSVSFRTSREEEIIGYVVKMLTFLNGIISPLLYCFHTKNTSSEKARKKQIMFLLHESEAESINNQIKC